MRKMLIDTLESKPSRLTTYPEGELLNLRIAEPEDANVGPTGILGYGFRPRSYQDLTLKISASGDFVENNFLSGAKFLMKPDDLRDADGDSIIDGDTNYMGQDGFWEIRFSQLLQKPDSIYCELYTNTAMKLTNLEHWKDASSTTGYIGIAVYMSRLISTDAILFYIHRLEERKHDGSSSPGYQWREVSASGLSGYESDTVDPYADIVELDDGSLLMVATLTNANASNHTEILFFKSFDCGEHWIKVDYDHETSYGVDHRVVVEKVGSRIIVVTYRETVGANLYLESMYSDDGGWTWSTHTEIENQIASNPSANSLDIVRGYNGKLYLTFLMDVAGSDTVVFIISSDGVNWNDTAVFPELGSGSLGETFSLAQHPCGAWMLFGIHGGQYVWRLLDSDDPEDDWSQATTHAITGTTDLIDGDGYKPIDICARFFGDAGFVDLGMINYDDHNDVLTIPIIMRAGMWDNITIATKPTRDWYGQGYPYSGDAHPNLDIFSSLGTVGTGRVSFQNDTDGFSVLRIVGDGANATYYGSPIPVDATIAGVVTRFSAKLLTGDFYTVHITSNSVTKDNEIDVIVIFNPASIIIWDFLAGAAAKTISLTNWSCNDWNDFIIATQGNAIQIYRSPRSHYLEFLHYELVGSTTVQADAYDAGTTRKITYGMSSYDSNWPDAISSWREIQLWTDSDHDVVSWDFDDDIVTGQKALLTREIGLMQGFSCRFLGAFAIEDDEWDLEVGAVYDPRNILTHSPSEQWRETEQSGASPERIFEWHLGNDSAGNEINTIGNGVALFGKNFLDFKLEILSNVLAATTVIDTAADHKAYICLRKVLKMTFGITPYSRIYENVVVLETEEGALAGTIEKDMIPGQYASNKYRNYYVEVIDGTAIGNVYRILDNNTQSLVLETDAETDGLSGHKIIAIFSDRVFFNFDDTRTGVTEAYGSFYGWRLTIPTTKTSPNENQLRLGKILIGRWTELKDDEWKMSMNTVSGLQVQEGFGGRKATRRLKQERRVLGMSYTGLNDVGAGINAVTSLAKVMRFGETPIAFIDDTTLLSSKIGNCEPILMRLSGDVNQRRVVYEKEDFIFDTTPTTKSMQRGVYDADMSFEEVI